MKGSKKHYFRWKIVTLVWNCSCPQKQQSQVRQGIDRVACCHAESAMEELTSNNAQ